MEILDDEILLTENELLYSIWTKPTLTLKYIFKFCPNKNVTLFMALAGIVNALERNQKDLNGETGFSIAFFAMAVVIGGLLGVVFGRLYAALLSWTGRWIKGTANSDQFVTVVAWSSVPTICSLILLVPNFLIFKNEPFRVNLQDDNLSKIIAFIIIDVIQITLSIWAFVIVVRGIALLQNFSTKKAVWNLILSILVIIGPILTILFAVCIFK